MTISTGDRLPEAGLLRMGSDGPETVALSSLSAGRKVVIFGLPGAFTGTCSTAHLPSFIRTRDSYRAKGVDDVICVSVNDPFVMDAWGDSTGAHEADIVMLADPSADLIKALGLQFTAPAAGLHDRSRRFAMLVEDGTVAVLDLEESAGVCENTTGEALLERI